jgi:hypothetical protein
MASFNILISCIIEVFCSHNILCFCSILAKSDDDKYSALFTNVTL